jgi:hypothetical protein
MTLVFNYQLLIAQVGINDNNSSPNASAMLDVKSDTKGMLIPRMTTTRRDAISSPATGLMIYNTSTNAFNFYNGTTWIEIKAGNIQIVSDADNDTKIQVEESADEDIIRFDAGGVEYMTLSDGKLGFDNNGLSVFIGKNAGNSDDKTTNENVFIGADAGVINTTGYQNVFLGSNTGNKNIIGGGNTFIGAHAGKNNTNNRNTFIGGFSGTNNTTGTKNTFIGGNAGFQKTTGNHNTYSGYDAGLKNTTGSNNTYYGYQAGFNNTLGSGNVFLGAQAGFNETGNNKLFIDNSNTATPLIYGEFDNNLLKINGELNILNSSGQIAAFESSFNGSGFIEVNNKQGTRALFGADGSGFTGGSKSDVVLANWSNGALKLYTNATERINISKDGLVEIKDTLKIADGSQGAGKVLVSDANGVATWQTLNIEVPDTAQPVPIKYHGDYIYVHPTDNASSLDWSTAKTICDNLTAFGKSDWYLPTRLELDAMYKQSYLITGLSQTEIVKYWSSTAKDATFAYTQRLDYGGPDPDAKTDVSGHNCRCVRKN